MYQESVRFFTGRKRRLELDDVGAYHRVKGILLVSKQISVLLSV
jgi:hypothetical protein